VQYLLHISILLLWYYLKISTITVITVGFLINIFFTASTGFPQEIRGNGKENKYSSTEC